MASGFPVEGETSVLSILDLPFLPLINIFSRLTHPERAKCSLVCRRFWEISHDHSFYTCLSPTRWAYGFWNSDDAVEGFSHFPIIASGTKNTKSEHLLNNQRIEHQFLTRMLMYVTGNAKIGPAVRKLDFSNSLVLNDSLLHIVLIQCPNVTSLDISNCSLVTSNAFHGLVEYHACRQLQYITVKNCLIDDSGLLALTKCWLDKDQEPNPHFMESSNAPGYLEFLVDDFFTSISKSGKTFDYRREFVTESSNNPSEKVISFPYFRQMGLKKVAGLKTLNLSGCLKITDIGLLYLLNVVPAIRSLILLDLSGCFKISGQNLKDFVLKCPNLKPESLNYCDHIRDGPYIDEANGCGNLQSMQCCVNEHM